MTVEGGGKKERHQKRGIKTPPKRYSQESPKDQGKVFSATHGDREVDGRGSTGTIPAIWRTDVVKIGGGEVRTGNSC